MIADAFDIETVPVPSHLDLPETDGLPMQNSVQPHQMALLTDAATPVLERLHPDGDYFVGQDCGIYWRLTRPPLDGCKAPDWYYVPGVPRLLDGVPRRSYVMLVESVPPLLVCEFVSGDGSAEHDATPYAGKFWVYERGIRAVYYAIFDPFRPKLEVYRLDGLRYRRAAADGRGLVPIPEMEMALGIWDGTFGPETGTWLRFYDARGRLMPTGAELAAIERGEKEAAWAEAASLRVELDAALRKLREKGIDPDAL